MSTFARILVVFVAAPVVFLGCTSTHPEAAFAVVEKAVGERSGHRVHWLQDDSSSTEIEQRVNALLQTNLTADSFVAIALLNNRQLQARFEEIGISQAEVAEATRLPNPTLAGSWRFPLSGAGGVNSEYSLAGRFLDLLVLPVRKRIAVRNLELIQLRIAHEVLGLAEEVQMAFYTLAARQQFANRLSLILEVNTAAADLAQRQFEAGNINRLQLRSQQLAQTQSRLDFSKIHAEIRAQREKLNRLLGLAGTQINWQIADELPALPAGEPTLEDAESVAVTRRLDLAAARGEASAHAEALRWKRKVRYLPGLNLGVNAEQELDHSWVVGPTLDLEVPIFDQGQAQLARLRAEYRRSLRRLEAMTVNVRSEVREARAAVVAAREAAEYHLKFLLPQNQQLLAETLLQYNAMQVGNYELLLTKQREQQAEQAAIEALRDYWIARVRLQTAVGGSHLPITGSSSEKSASPKPREKKSDPHSHH